MSREFTRKVFAMVDPGHRTAADGLIGSSGSSGGSGVGVAEA